MRLQRGWHLLLRNMPLAHRVITCIKMKTAKTVHIHNRVSRFLNMRVTLRINCMRFYCKCGILKQIASPPLSLSLSLLCPNILLLKQLISISLGTFIVIHIGVNITSLYESISKHFNYINKIQRDATICMYLFTAKSLYVFRASIAPIFRVHKTVTAASSTGLCTPDDGCDGRPKHVEWFCSK